jgi:hypothetical protein
MMVDYMILLVVALTGYWGFIAGQIYESNRPQREAKKEAIRRLTEEVLKEAK